MVALGLGAGTALAGATRATHAATAPVVATGITARTVTVGGLLGADASAPGADVGAQARFRRANTHGGVAGRTIVYAGTEHDAGDPAQDAATVQKLRGEVFAVVPAVGSTVDTATLAAAQLPFFGAAASPGWDANRFGFGFAGAQAVRQTRVVSPAWGVQLRALLGAARGTRVALATDDDAPGTSRAAQTRASLRAAGFAVAAPATLPTPPAPLPDLAPVAAGLVAASPVAVVLLTSSATTADIAGQLAARSYAGTVATTESFYQPTIPALANGLTVLVPYAPFEQSTAANRRLAADVKAFAPGTPLTPGLAAGYWAADLFVAALSRTGRRLTPARFLAIANRGTFSHSVPQTVGPSTWPAMHTREVPCGALVQSDGSRYFVAEPYRCGAPVVAKPAAKPKAKSKAKSKSTAPSTARSPSST